MPVMSADSYLSHVLPALDDTADRFAALVTSAPDPAVRVPASPEWTVRDVAAHLATVTVRYAEGPRGRGTWTPTPAGLAGLNHQQIRALGTASAGELADRMRQDLAALRDQIQGYGTRCLPSGSTAARRYGPMPRWASCWASWWSTGMT